MVGQKIGVPNLSDSNKIVGCTCISASGSRKGQLSIVSPEFLNVPTGIKGESVENPSIDKLIGIKDILTTLPKILSIRFEGGLLPIELVHGIASLSTYPSAKALELFARAKGID